MEISVPKRPLVCYIGSRALEPRDPYLKRLDLCAGLVFFGIPHYGVQFKCRAEGESIDLEFGAFFALLRTLTTKLKDEPIREIEIHSSSPQFVFAFTGRSPHLETGSEREKLLKEYSSKLKIQIKFVSLQENRAFVSPADYPALPTNRYVDMKPDPFDFKNIKIKPFQRGIYL